MKETIRVRYFLLLAFAVMAFTVTASAQSVESVYTNLGGKTCKILERDAAAAAYRMDQCSGIAGYKVRVTSQDERQGLAIVKPDGSVHELDLGYIGGGGFSYIGPKAEWRVRKQKGKLVPIALIVRFNVSTGGEGKETSYLAVSKITPQSICYVEAIDPGPSANMKARQSADTSAAKPCYKLESPGN
jgi:hypothetical protein